MAEPDSISNNLRLHIANFIPSGGTGTTNNGNGEITHLPDLIRTGQIRLNTSNTNNKPSDYMLSVLNYFGIGLHADEAALNKLSEQERNQYEMLFTYTNSKSHGMNMVYDHQIEEWNKNHPDCKIRSQYD